MVKINLFYEMDSSKTLVSKRYLLYVMKWILIELYDLLYILFYQMVLTSFFQFPLLLTVLQSEVRTMETNRFPMQDLEA